MILILFDVFSPSKFDKDNVMPESERNNVTQDAIVVLHPETGEVLESFGANL